MYSPLLQYPFVQDDWGMIRQYMFHSTSSVFLDILTPAGKFFFRPFGNFYCWIVYALFGLHPLGFHLLALIALGASSFLVVKVAGTLTGDQRVAWGSGFLYAGASNIHIDPQMWLAGAFDIGAGLFALLSVDSFIRKRYSRSALWFALALGFKESMAMLLFVLAAWALLNRGDSPDRKPALRRAFNQLRWHCFAFAALVGAKIPGVAIFSLPETHPYAARLFGSNIGAAFQLFALSGLQAVTPLKSAVFSEYAALMTLFVVTAALVLVFIAGISHFGGRENEPGRPLIVTVFILVWFFLMLYPSLTLINHFSRYYLTAALPPLVIGTILVLKITLLSTGRSARFILLATIAFAAANVIDGTVSVYHRSGLGVLDGIHASGRDGDNHFIRKASLVRGAWKPLLAVLPALPPHSLLVLEDFETGSFADKYGLQVWYGDSTLLLTSSVPEGPDSLGMFHATVAVEDPWNRPGKPPVITFPASRTIQVRSTPKGLEIVPAGTRAE